MATTKRRYSKEEFARRGDAIYKKDRLKIMGSQGRAKVVKAMKVTIK